MVSKGKNTRNTVTIALRDLFYQRGYAATSYADIAKETGLAKGNIQYYFNTKDEMLAAAVEQRLVGIRKLLEEWTLECGTPHDCLSRFIDMIERNAEDLSRYGCPIGTLNGELGKNEQHLQHVSRKMFDLFQMWLQARFLAIFPADEAKEKAEFLMVMAQGISVLAHTYNNPEIVHRQIANMRTWLAVQCTGEIVRNAGG